MVSTLICPQSAHTNILNCISFSSLSPKTTYHQKSTDDRRTIGFHHWRLETHSPPIRCHCSHYTHINNWVWSLKDCGLRAGQRPHTESNAKAERQSEKEGESVRGTERSNGGNGFRFLFMLFPPLGAQTHLPKQYISTGHRGHWGRAGSVCSCFC